MPATQSDHPARVLEHIFRLKCLLSIGNMLTDAPVFVKCRSIAGVLTDNHIFIMVILIL
jgi:hypothetical protein